MIAYRSLLVIISLTTAKYLQARLAAKLGDSTPKALGRLSINPLVHIDIFGTIILPMFLLIISRGALVLGYTKHLPLNEYHFKKLHRDRLLLGITIIAAHLFISICAILLIKITPYLLHELLLFFARANIMLTFFNLIPIPPLEGSKIFASLLPRSISYNYLRLERYGPILIAVLFMFGIIPTYMRLATESLLHYTYGF